MGTINASGLDFKGFYSWEVSEKTFRRCRIAAMDLHWFHCLPAFMTQAAMLKRISPGLKIIAGGITAGLMSRYLFTKTPIDYIVLGNTETSFRELAQKIARSEAVAEIPGVLTRTAPVKDPGERRYDAALDNLDTFTIGWFPTLKSYTLNHHASIKEENPRFVGLDHYHPYIPTVRGCETNCRGCYGSYSPVFFPGAPAIRSPESILRAIKLVEDNPDYRFVNILGDFITRIGVKQSKKAFPKASRLYCAYHFCRVPDPEEVELLINAFRFTHLHINLRRHEFAYGKPAFEEHMARLLEIAGGYSGHENIKLILYALAKKTFETCSRLTKRFPSLEVRDNREWYLVKPDSRNYTEGGKLKRAEMIYKRTVEFQNSSIGLGILTNNRAGYSEPSEYPSETEPRDYMPGMQAPPFRMRPIHALPDMPKNSFRLISKNRIRSKGTSVKFKTHFLLNGKCMSCRLNATNENPVEYFTIEYAPGRAVRDPFADRVEMQPVFRLPRVVGLDAGECLFLRVFCVTDEFTVEVRSGEQALMNIKCEELFRVAAPARGPTEARLGGVNIVLI